MFNKGVCKMTKKIACPICGEEQNQEAIEVHVLLHDVGAINDDGEHTGNLKAFRTGAGDIPPEADLPLKKSNKLRNYNPLDFDTQIEKLIKLRNCNPLDLDI